MAKVFFSATENAYHNITDMFNSIWPTAVSLWNTRCTIKGILLENKNLTSSQINNKFSLGSNIHGANMIKIFEEKSWEEQQEDFAWIILNHIISIYEGWIEEMGEIFINIDSKYFQFEKNINSNISECNKNKSVITQKCFYSYYANKAKHNKTHLPHMMHCYRIFKEIRNCYMHHRKIADQKLIDAYANYSSITNNNLGVKEVPIVNPIYLNCKISLNLRGVVGFCAIICNLLILLDTELIMGKDAEKELLKKFKKHADFQKKQLADQSMIDKKIQRLAKKSNLPNPTITAELRKFIKDNQILNI